MKSFTITVAGVGALAAAALGLAGTASAAGGADVTVNDLTTQGYTVQLTGTPSAPLTACTVTNVKKDPGGTTAYVDFTCPDGC